MNQPFKIIDITKPCNPAELQPGKIHLQVLRQTENIPGPVCTRTIRDKDGNMISQTNPDFVAMGSLADEVEAGPITQPVDRSMLRIALWILMAMVFAAGFFSCMFLSHLHFNWN